MTSSVLFPYYYGAEGEQYSFYRIPKLLFTDSRFANLSTDAKLLYGVLLDRMSLSMKNGWHDELGRIYIIFTLEDVAETLGYKTDKAIKLFNELDSQKGVGLIERVRKGQGKASLIYVKNFAGESRFGKNELSSSVKSSSKSRKNRVLDFGKTEFLTSEKPNSWPRKNRVLDFGKTETINTEDNNTERVR